MTRTLDDALRDLRYMISHTSYDRIEADLRTLYDPATQSYIALGKALEAAGVRDLLAAATGGEWFVEPTEPDDVMVVIGNGDGLMVEMPTATGLNAKWNNPFENAALITALHNIVAEHMGGGSGDE